MKRLSNHYPVPVTVELLDFVGDVEIVDGTEVQVRCGCDNSYRYDYGHEGARR